MFSWVENDQIRIDLKLINKKKNEIELIFFFSEVFGVSAFVSVASLRD